MGGSEISASGWAKGILLSILASVIGGISKLAIRKSWLLQAGSDHNHGNVDNLLRNDTSNNSSTESTIFRNDDEQTLGGEDERRRKNLLPYCLRYSGMFGMSVLNPICCVLAMNYASPSILAPFSGLTLVWVISGSPLVNSEKPSSRQILACCFIIVGEVIVAIFGDHTNDEGVTVEAVVSLFQIRLFPFSFCFAKKTIIDRFYCLSLPITICQQMSYRKPAFILYFVGLIVYAIVLVYWINRSESFILRRFAWGCSGGAITGTQNFLKDSLTIIKATEPDQKLPLIFYPLCLLGAGTAFTGLLVLTACMKRYDATYSSASFVGSFVVSASIMAAVHYDTFQELDGVLNYVLYPCGIFVLMVGVNVLVRESSECSEYDDAPEQLRALDDNDEIGFDDSEDLFGYTEVEEEVKEEILV
mmetsp:Transcript_24195/g.51080  ORF Transcript_24195/g.51080 Transcript_24195/m.51080 type:complete len:417 (+) Transcript_24195:244-1494(+)|eukprot:CAMPEP_0168201142 /NCGR_PEP_ID=MMETSP0139_2-20121125/23496_1 /TAXON_ID=44445 /ORGANISM="Pseudo-nitzschia australis, Strain 10249 10 AB" /LENGTH=416 /DNA_ID=CAMNT_0008126573 /DNA_START=217 /DNA_END=1467 /DNA_ORIENTATION=-